MFDPFKDYEIAGYLRNTHAVKDLDVIKKIEHDLFAANFNDAINFLSKIKEISYKDFLKVHQILFEDLYPWAGQDRTVTAPNSSIIKGETRFAAPHECRLAVDAGLKFGQDKKKITQSPGEVMGLFAFGHPFLDGNGRTMILVHSELCHRAGFSIDWQETRKADYLSALSEEIENPRGAHLDRYLSNFIRPQVARQRWSATIGILKGLDGLGVNNVVDGDFSDPNIAKKYKDFSQRRGYELSEATSSVTCTACES